jgi:hypothetical protein
VHINFARSVTELYKLLSLLINSIDTGSLDWRDSCVVICARSVTGQIYIPYFDSYDSLFIFLARSSFIQMNLSYCISYFTRPRPTAGGPGVLQRHKISQFVLHVTVRHLRRCPSLISKPEIRTTKGFAGEGNVGEASASELNPEPI